MILSYHRACSQSRSVSTAIGWPADGSFLK